MKMSFGKVTSTEHYSRYEQAAKTAKEKGLIIVVPGTRELFVDIDSAADMEAFTWNFPAFCDTEDSGVTAFHRASPSGEPDHFHIVVTLGRDVVSISERIMLQCLLGSDRVRERLSWQRMLHGDPVPTLFFEKPDYADPVTDDPVTVVPSPPVST